jgi:hypothetical protein
MILSSQKPPLILVNSKLTLILITILAILTVNTHADNTYTIPNNENSVQIDGIINESEWIDSKTVQFTAVNGEIVKVWAQYDVIETRLCFAVNIPDSTYDNYDRFFICIDNNNNIEKNPQPNDFILCFSRGTAYMGMYHQYYDYYRVVGTGSEWDINNLRFDSRILSKPFRAIHWSRTETRDTWIIEVAMDLNRSLTQNFDFGLVFKQTDTSEGLSDTVFYPLFQPEAGNYPSNWMHASIPFFSQEAVVEDVDGVSESQGVLDSSEVSNRIPGFPILAICFGVILFSANNRLHRF